MTTMWEEEQDTEAAEYDDSELFGDMDGEEQDDLEWADESYDGEDEESRARRRRRARALRRARLAQARARARARARGPRPAGAMPATRPAASAAAAIRSVDLESKVANDSLRREMISQRKRMTRSEYAAVAGIAVNQFVESFQQPENAYAKAALRFAPLLLLSPQRRGRGVEGFVTDPRVLGGAAVLGLAFLGEQRNKASLDVASVAKIGKGNTAKFGAQVLSSKGEVIAGRTVQWDTSDPNIATVDSAGNVTGVNPGPVFIIARAEGLPAKRIPLIVK